VAAAVVLAFCVLTAVLFVYPDLNAPVPSGAIVVLGGQGRGSLDEGVALAKRGDAPSLVLSLVPGERCPRRVAGRPQVRVLCFRADPLSTRGEARAIARLAAQHRWHRVIVVMPTTQASRARLRIGRCYPGQVLEVGVDPSGVWRWMREIVYEWAALGKALILQPTC
jgi:uncharacterized SAM-binding protein YcdF (DUF218 family)